jgi:glycosyltransferase involved in cell wall biosynthesis
VHCGLEQAFHHGAPAGAQAALRLVCVGRLCEQKGQLLLVEAAEARRRFRPVRSSWCSPGDGEMRAEIEALIDRLGLRANVRITGWVANDRGARGDPRRPGPGPAELRRRACRSSSWRRWRCAAR